MEIITLIILFIIFYYFQDKRYSRKIGDVSKLYENNLKLEREKAIKQSKDVTRGQISEQLLPLFPNFPYRLSECRFHGAPVDYIIYEGMDNVRDSVKDAQISIIFADVKVGSAQKTKVQNAIKNAINEGRVKFETFTVNTKEKDLKLIIK